MLFIFLVERMSTKHLVRKSLGFHQTNRWFSNPFKYHAIQGKGNYTTSSHDLSVLYSPRVDIPCNTTTPNQTGDAAQLAEVVKGQEEITEAWGPCLIWVLLLSLNPALSSWKITNKTIFFKWSKLSVPFSYNG